MNKKLIRELEQRGTAEISDGVISQVTQAIDESESRVSFLQFGELKSQGIIPIEEACSKCDFWEGKFANTQMCQEVQTGGAKARGFNKLICSNQFVE